MPNALVTGGAGFIGSHLASYLFSNGYGLRILDNLSSGKIKNLSGVSDNIEFTEGDIRDRPLALALMNDVDFIFHLAAIPEGSHTGHKHKEIPCWKPWFHPFDISRQG